MTQRRQDIELLRIVAAFGIVWFHAATDGIAIAYSGLVVFLVLSVFLGGKPAPPDARSLRRRAVRLLRPWLLWGVVYGAVNTVRGIDALPAGPNIVARLLVGPSIHLWYLPFVFLGLIGIDVLKAHVSAPRLAYGSALVALAGIATAPFWRPVSLGLPYPLLQWADAAVPMAVGLWLHSARQLPPWQARTTTLLLVATSAVVACFNGIGVSFAIAFALCGLVASGWTAALVRFRVQPVADAMFGVYLIHPLVFLALLVQTTLRGDALPLAIFPISLAVVLLQRRAWPRLAPAWSRAQHAGGPPFKIRR